jgi:hypothetical protein
MTIAVRRRAIPLVLPLAVAVAVVASACSLTSSVTGPREWTQTVTSADGSTQEIVVRDESGRLTNVEIDPQGVPMASEITNPPGGANVVLVPWTGGACDKRTEITFKAAGQGLAGTLKVDTEGDICIMIAVAHQLRLTSGEPLPAAQVTLEPTPRADDGPSLEHAPSSVRDDRAGARASGPRFHRDAASRPRDGRHRCEASPPARSCQGQPRPVRQHGRVAVVSSPLVGHPAFVHADVWSRRRASREEAGHVRSLR